jgi:hypothetical protein
VTKLVKVAKRANSLMKRLKPSATHAMRERKPILSRRLFDATTAMLESSRRAVQRHVLIAMLESQLPVTLAPSLVAIAFLAR